MGFNLLLLLGATDKTTQITPCGRCAAHPRSHVESRRMDIGRKNIGEEKYHTSCGDSRTFGRQLVRPRSSSSPVEPSPNRPYFGSARFAHVR
jgi:hypothetical protein